MKIIYHLLFIFLFIACTKKTSENEGKVKIRNPFYDKAFELQDQDEADSAFIYFYRAKDVFLQKGDSFGAAKCITNLAIIQETKGDYFGSQETATSAITFFNSLDSSQFQYVSLNYNALGIASSKLQNQT